MASKKENLKGLFANTRSRIIIIFTATVLLIGVTIGFFKYSSILKPKNIVSANLAVTPGIESIPGARNQTAEYAGLQMKQNIEQAQAANKTGKSSIPTLISSQGFGNGVESVGPQGGTGGLGFEALSMQESSGPQQSLWLQALKDGNCSKNSVNTVVSQGAVVSDLIKVCSCMQLKDDGYSLKDLDKVCSCKDLKAAGFNALDMKNAGYSATRLRACGFNACELRAAGFTAQQLKDAGFSDDELKGAGYSPLDISKASGLPDGITADMIRKAGCQADALQRLRNAGVTAAAIRRISGCSAAQLKAAGFTAQDLKNAGFSAADLLRAGFTPEQLKDAGFSARDLLDAGLTPAELEAAGFTPASIKAAEDELPLGMTADDVKAAGCNAGPNKCERLAGVSASQIHKNAACNVKNLLAGGFNPNDIQNAGFSPKELSGLPMVSDDEIKAAGCDANKLKELSKKGVSAKQIHDLNACNAQILKNVGFNAKDLIDAGFKSDELLAAAFSPDQIKTVQEASDKALSIEKNIKAAACDATKLKAVFTAGVAAKQIHELNACGADVLKTAGYNAVDLTNAGFTPEQLLAAGFTSQDLTKSGLTPSCVIAAGRVADCSVSSLKAARALGVTAATIKQTLGCSAKALKDAGYTAAELKAAGFTAAELKNAGFTAAELKAAGFTAKELRAAGFSAADLKAAGFTAAELKDAGFSAAELKAAGFTAAELKAAGFSAAELKAAGFSLDALRKAGFSAKALKDAGFSADQLKNAGFSTMDLQAAGFSEQESTLAGLQAELQGPKVASNVPTMPSIAGGNANAASAEAENAKKLQAILKNQQDQMAQQRYQQQITDRSNVMAAAANTLVQGWKTTTTQVYIGASKEPNNGKQVTQSTEVEGSEQLVSSSSGGHGASGAQPLIKAGDVVFAVMDTSVNSDEPGPILATVVSGKFNGAKLIGSFTLPSNADKMVIRFSTLSVPGASKTTSINAYAIDPNTARTALSSRTDHHYLLRYGSLFASTFLEGFGNAFQSANTTITVGGTGGQTNTTVQNGVGRSVLENAVIGLATLGKQWGQVAQNQFNTPTTVDVYAGTGIGVLFTQDLKSL